MPLHLARRELDDDKGEVCLVREGPGVPEPIANGFVHGGQLFAELSFHPGPQLRRDYPLNLSISISGGKETNRDSPSNGERSGNSSSLKSPAHSRRIVAERGTCAR